VIDYNLDEVKKDKPIVPYWFSLGRFRFILSSVIKSRPAWNGI
jgi:hypothetical protein